MTEPITPDAELLQGFSNMLKSMPNLTTLDWNTFGHGSTDFAETFRSSHLTMQHVTQLFIGKDSGWMIELCPNVRRLEISGHGGWISSGEGKKAMNAVFRATEKAAQLEHFAYQGIWALSTIKGL